VRALLRSVWDEPRAPSSPARVWRDWALVVALPPIALTEWILRPGLPMRPLQLALTLGLIPTLLWRRTRPLLMVATAFIGCYAVQAATHDAVPAMLTPIFLILLAYSLFRWGSGRHMVIGSAIVVVNVAIAWLLGNQTIAQSGEGLGVLAAAAATGVAMRYRAIARAREFEHTKLLERERLARDLHDTVAHHVSAIAIRAQAGLAASPSQPDAAAEALHLIESEATTALAEMRAIVKVMRSTERIADLKQLVRSGEGPAVDVEIAGYLDDIAPAVGSAIYRLAQESVTNARRHARHATRIKVRVTADETKVHLNVSDDGETIGAAASKSTGYGLKGMTERAGLVGGTIEAGPNPDRGWTVTAVLPRSGSPA
jgi:signal transduction histidine kinase